MEPGAQFHQLPMFMEARELRHGITPGDSAGYGSHNEMWDEKLSQAKSWSDNRWSSDPTPSPTSMHDSIGQQGVKSPVEVRHGTSRGSVLYEGHHRVASAYAHNPRSLVPVLHDELVHRPPADVPDHGLAG